jgi:hypothetical protein
VKYVNPIRHELMKVNGVSLAEMTSKKAIVKCDMAHINIYLTLVLSVERLYL